MLSFTLNQKNKLPETNTLPDKGTVTLFFSDIEGSTRLLQTLKEKYTDILNVHHRLLRQSITNHKGKEIDTAGDGFFVIFESAKDSVNAAVEAQALIQNNDWGNANLVSVRMGIHTGETHHTSSGYVGIDVHRAARICAAGHGGQVLLSETTKALIENELPENISLKYLGEHELKDLAFPEKLYQLNIKGLRNDFPALRSKTQLKTNLPENLIKLIGREKEIEYVKDLIANEDVRVLTISGPGGIGKTSLALRSCSELLDSYKDGVFVAFLASIDDQDLVPSAIIQALGLSEHGDEPAMEILKKHLHDKQLLLFLDNYEQITDAAWVISELSAACPNLKIIITSRIVLHIKGEQEYSLSPLAVPQKKDIIEIEGVSQFAAIQLFVKRAKAIKPEFEITSENAAAIAELCIQLDGLPLAIELACARIKLFTPQAMLSRLSSRLNLLKGGARDAPERHQTLRQAIAWSYDILSENEKVLFEALSVFVGGGNLEAIEKVCSEVCPPEYDILDGLQALVDKSLIRRVDDDYEEARFIMLETIREFAWELLNKSKFFEAAKDSHMHYFAALAEKAEPHLTSSQMQKWLEILENDFDNIRTALKWSIINKNAEYALRFGAALWRFWIIRRSLNDGFSHLQEIMDVHGTVNFKELKAKVLFAAGTIMHEMNDLQIAHELEVQALELYKQSGNKNGLLKTLNSLAWISGHMGELANAVRYVEEATALNKEVKDRREEAVTLNNLCWFNIIRADFDEAEKVGIEGLKIREEIGDVRGEAFAKTSLGWIHSFKGNYDSAKKLLDEAMLIQNKINDKQLIAWTKRIYADNEHGIGNYPSAIDIINEALDLMKIVSNDLAISQEYGLLGHIYHDLGDMEKGILYINKAKEIVNKLSAKYFLAKTLLWEAEICTDMHDLLKAEQIIKQCIALSQYLGDKLGFAENLESLARICFIKEEIEKAGILYSEAGDIRKELNIPMTCCGIKRHKPVIEKISANINVANIKQIPIEQIIKQIS